MSVNSKQLLDDPIGNYPAATVACFDPTCGELPRRELDEATNRRFLEKLAQAGAPAVLIAASTGHGHLRSVEELAAWFRSAAEADLGSTVKMALLRPEDGAEANAQLLDLLREHNYPVVFIRPGTDLAANATEDQVVANLAPLVVAAAERELAVGVYSISDVSGLLLSASATAQLVAGRGGKNIVAAKVTEAIYETSTKPYLKHPALAHLKIVQGWDPHLAQALREGPQHDASGRQRCGVTSGPMSFAVYQYIHMFEAAARHDWDELSAAESAVTALFSSMQDDPTKFADLQRAKAIMGLGQPLTGSVTDEQIEKVLSAFSTLPRSSDRERLARSLDLMGAGPYHERLEQLCG